MERKHFKVHEANILFLTLAIIFITVGATAQAWDVHLGLIITEYLIIALPVILAGVILKVDLKSALKLNPIKGRTVARIIGISILIIPTVAVANLIPIAILGHFNKVILPEIPSPKTTLELLISFFIIAISPGICEELFFRGMVLNAYENTYNKKTAAIMAAIMFGVFHFNIQNLFGPIIIGLAAAYIMHITKSLYGAMVLHMSNNAIAVFSDYWVTRHPPQGVDVANATASYNGNTAYMLTTIVTMIVLATIGLFFVRLLLNGLKRDSFYYALGEPFEMDGQVYYLVEKESNHGKIVSKTAAFSGGTYNLSAEKRVVLKSLNAKHPKRIHDIWEDNAYKEVVDAKAFAPIVGVLCLYVYLLYQFLSYTG